MANEIYNQGTKLENGNGNLVYALPEIMTGYMDCLQEDLEIQWLIDNANGWNMNLLANGGFMFQTLDVPTGFGDYPDACECFPTGNFKVENQTWFLGVKRAIKWCWDRKKDADTKGIATAANILKTFRKKQAIPEYCTYTYSKLYAIAKELGQVSEGNDYIAQPTGMSADIRNAVLNITENTSYNESDLAIIMSNTMVQNLKNSGDLLICCGPLTDGNAIMKYVGDMEWKKGQQSYMKTAIQLNNGFDGEYGFTVDALAKDINFIICPKNETGFKLENLKEKAFTPDQDDCGDSWKLLKADDYDALVLPCGLEALYVNTK